MTVFSVGVLISFFLVISSGHSMAGETQPSLKPAGNSRGTSVKTAGGAVNVPADDAEAGLINLNLAGKEQLMTLPGIGEIEAQKIIDGRPYHMKTQLFRKGIVSQDTFYLIAEKISVDLKAYDRAIKEKAKKAFNEELQKSGKNAKMVKTRSGLAYQDLVPGTGKSAAAGKTVKVQYTGWLEDGTKFDSSVGREKPFIFVIGKGSVIRGWDEGVKSMKVGGKRRLFIPPKLGYGEKGAGSKIPPNATLIFDVEMLQVGE